MPLWSTGDFRVVLCRGDGSEAGHLISFPAIVAAYRRVLPDSSYGVGDSFDSRSRGRAVAVADFLRGSSHSYSATSCVDSRSRNEWSTLLDSPEI